MRVPRFWRDNSLHNLLGSVKVKGTVADNPNCLLPGWRHGSKATEYFKCRKSRVGYLKYIGDAPAAGIQGLSGVSRRLLIPPNKTHVIVANDRASLVSNSRRARAMTVEQHDQDVCREA